MPNEIGAVSRTFQEPVTPACTVRVTTQTPNGYLPTGDDCGAYATEEWSDEIVGWVNDVWAEQGHMMMGSFICDDHVEMTPEI